MQRCFACHPFAWGSWHFFERQGVDAWEFVIAGKAGAIVGAFGFGQLFLTAGISTTLAILAATNFLGEQQPSQHAVTHYFSYSCCALPSVALWPALLSGAVC